MPKTTSAAAKRAGRKRTDGAGAPADIETRSQRKKSRPKPVAEVELSSKQGAKGRRPILKRKLDILYLVFFVMHVPVMLGKLLDLIVFWEGGICLLILQAFQLLSSCWLNLR